MENFEQPNNEENNNSEGEEPTEGREEISQEALKERNQRFKEWHDEKYDKFITEHLEEEIFEEFSREQRELTDRIETTYSDWNDRALVQILKGGSGVNAPNQEDYPGEGSIIGFFEKWLGPFQE